MLFEADVREKDPREVLVEVQQRRADEGEQPFNPYVNDLVNGVVDNRAVIDELLRTYAIGWTLDRMPAVDRNVLRLGVYELLFQDEIPDKVAISEAVALVTRLSAEESVGFVNGLLARIMELKPTLGLATG